MKDTINNNKFQLDWGLIVQNIIMYMYKVSVINSVTKLTD